MASLWMIFAGFSFALMGVLIKLVSTRLAVPDILFYRSLINLLVVGLLMGRRGESLRTPVLGLHLTRAITGNLALVLMFHAIANLPIATATTLNYTNPIFLALFSLFVVSERPTWSLSLGVVLGFLGILFILRPSLSADQHVDGLVGLGSGLCTALAYYNVGLLVRRGEPETRVVFYFALTGLVGSLLWLSFTRFSELDLHVVLYIVGFGTCGTVGQLAMTRAYGRGHALITGVLSYSTVVFSSLLGWLLCNEVLTWSTMVGIVLIIAGGVLALHLNRARRARERLMTPS